MDESQNYRPNDEYYDATSLQLEEMLYARHVELTSLEDLTLQRGTPIPSLFQNYYKFIQNPSSISVDTFKRMIDTDDTIGSGVDFLTTCLSARWGRYKHKSKEITEWVNKALDLIDGGWENTRKEFFSASWAGFYCGEKVWKNAAEGFIIECIAPLPPTTVLFEVDRTGRLTDDGVLQFQRNWSPLSLSYGINFFGGPQGMSNIGADGRPDPFARFGDLPFPLRTANIFNYLSIRIPKQKIFHYAYDAQGKFGNPYGRSLLRRCYKYYVMKDAFLRMYATALDRKGTPLTLVWVDPNTTFKDPNRAQPGVNHRGQRVGIDPFSAARETFKNIHNDSVIILPGKKDQYIGVESLTQEANMDGFGQALDFCNKSIMRGLLIPSLIFGNGDGTGSYSLGETHSKTYDKILDGTNAGAKREALHQIVKELVAYNFPRSAWEKDGIGEFTTRELSAEERQKEMDCVEKAVNVGAVDMNDLNDLNEVRQKAGFSERDTPIPQVQVPEGFGEGFDKGDENGDEENSDGGSVPGGPNADGTPKGQPPVDRPRRPPGRR